MGFLDKAKKLAERAGPLIDKAAPHARTAVEKAGQQIDKRTGGKYHDKIEQAGHAVGDYADKRMAASGSGAQPTDDGFPPTPPPATTPPADTPPADTAPADTPPSAAAPPADTAGPTDTAPPPPAANPNAPGDRPTSDL